MLNSFDEVLQLSPKQLAICCSEIEVDVIASAFSELMAEDLHNFFHLLSEEKRNEILKEIHTNQVNYSSQSIQDTQSYMVDVVNEFANMGLISLEVDQESIKEIFTSLDPVKAVLDQSEIDALVGFSLEDSFHSKKDIKIPEVDSSMVISAEEFNLLFSNTQE